MQRRDQENNEWLAKQAERGPQHLEPLLQKHRSRAEVAKNKGHPPKRSNVKVYEWQYDGIRYHTRTRLQKRQYEDAMWDFPAEHVHYDPITDEWDIYDPRDPDRFRKGLVPATDFDSDDEDYDTPEAPESVLVGF